MCPLLRNYDLYKSSFIQVHKVKEILSNKSFPQGSSRRFGSNWLGFSVLGAMVTSGEWEHQAVNNWRGVCNTDGLLALSKVSWALTQIPSNSRIRKWSNRVHWWNLAFTYGCCDTWAGEWLWLFELCLLKTTFSYNWLFLELKCSPKEKKISCT